MSLILESYNAEAETTLLSKARDDTSTDTSLIEIVDNEKQTLLSIKVGSNDRETIQRLVKIWSYAEHRYVEPGERLPKVGIELVDSYQKMCDALLKLNSPVLYRKAEHESKDGYLVDSAALRTIIGHGLEVFANVRLAGCVSSCSGVVKDMVYESVNVEFNREPWEPPIVEPPSLPQNLFQKLRSVFTRD